MLNALFGIQARGGCSCAGPYGHRLLGQYQFDPRTGHWRHHQAPPDPVPSLADLLDGPTGPSPGAVAGEDVRAGYQDAARAVLAAGPAGGAGPSLLPPDLERLRDFSLPPLPV